MTKTDSAYIQQKLFATMCNCLSRNRNRKPGHRRQVIRTTTNPRINSQAIRSHHINNKVATTSRMALVSKADTRAAIHQTMAALDQMMDLVMGRAWIFQAMTCRSKKEGKQTNGIQETENGPQKGLLLHKKQHQVH